VPEVPAAHRTAAELAAAGCRASSEARNERIRLLKCLDDDADSGTSPVAPLPRHRLTVARARCERFARQRPPAAKEGTGQAASGEPLAERGGGRVIGASPSGHGSGEGPSPKSPHPEPEQQQHLQPMESGFHRRDLGRLQVSAPAGPTPWGEAMSHRGGAAGPAAAEEVATASREAWRRRRRHPVVARADSKALEVPKVGFVADTVAFLLEFERALGSGTAAPAELRALGGALEARCYQLRPKDVIRGMTLAAEGAKQLEERLPEERRLLDLCAPEIRAAAALLDAAHTCAASLATAVSLQGDAALVADMMFAMSVTRTGRQAYLDAALARLLEHLRMLPQSFKPSVVARVAGALGRMQAEEGPEGKLTAGLGQTNQRFLATFKDRFHAVVPELFEDDFGLLHESFVAAFLSEEEVRRLIDRAAHLQMGLLPESANHLDRMRRIFHASLAQHPFIARTLPDFTRQYCDRLERAR